MGKMVKYFSSLPTRRVIFGLITLCFVLSSFISITLAWSSMSQCATNPIEGENVRREVILEKFERDVNGDETDNPLEGAEFLLFRINADGTETQIGNVWTTDSDGLIHVTGLEPGDYVFVEITPPSGYGFDLDSSGDAITRYYFAITGDEEIGEPVLVTVFNRRLTGSLITEKTVRNADGSDLTEAQRNQQFEFIVTAPTTTNSTAQGL